MAASSGQYSTPERASGETRAANSRSSAPAPQPRSHTRSPRRTEAKAARARLSPPRGKQVSDWRYT
ncbi:MAG: hypothetical protein ACLUFL_07170, partial [Flavonifractor plautii]